MAIIANGLPYVSRGHAGSSTGLGLVVASRGLLVGLGSTTVDADTGIVRGYVTPNLVRGYVTPNICSGAVTANLLSGDIISE